MHQSKFHRVILVGPSIDLSPARRSRWFREITGELRISDSDFVVGVDGGNRFLKTLGGKTKPQLLIGDWDSFDRKTAESARSSRTRVITLAKEKDYSDLAAALEEVASLDCSELLLLGFTGGRPDHHLSNLLEILNFGAMQRSKGRFQKTAAIGPEAEYHFLTHKQSLQIKRAPGTVVSVFAMGAKAEGVSMKGFEYSLKNESLRSSSRGLSNSVCTRAAEIRVRRGALLAIIPAMKSPVRTRHG